MSFSITVHVEVGDRFGRGVVVDPEVRRRVRGALLRCDCGSEYWVAVSDLKAGRTRSCGCFNRDRARAAMTGRANPSFTHGMYGHPLYQTWSLMLHRCEDPNQDNYRYYGARGISVCADWHDVTAFVTWIDANLGPRPDGCTLDRINNDGNYEPGNVRWATQSMQVGNQRKRAPGPDPEVTRQRRNEAKRRRRALMSPEELEAERAKGRARMSRARIRAEDPERWELMKAAERARYATRKAARDA
jgi:hypothetical protein